MELPALIPIFPLPNVVLFPGVPLALHIFEPRYREMVRDVQEHPNGLIGMALLRGDWRREYHDKPEIFTSGCAGQMVRVESLKDGRSNILLHGMREFVVLEEDASRSYGQARVRWRPSGGKTLPPDFRRRLRDLLGRFVSGREPKLAQKLLHDASVSDELFVNLFCFALSFSPLEKQALLEAPSLLERGARLEEVVQFALEAGEGAAPAEERYH